MGLNKEDLKIENKDEGLENVAKSRVNFDDEEGTEEVNNGAGILEPKLD